VLNYILPIFIWVALDVSLILPSLITDMENKLVYTNIEDFIKEYSVAIDFESMPEMTMLFKDYISNPTHPKGEHKNAWIASSKKHSVFIKTLNEIAAEKNLVEVQLRQFAADPFNYVKSDALFIKFFNENEKSRVSLEMINQQLLQLMVRYQRINAVIETRSKNAIITHDGTYKYNTHKIYWYDDLGNSVRNVTRNDGEEEANEANIIDKLKRVYGKQQYKVVNEYAIQFGNRKIRPDLVIEKDGEKLVLEIKKSDASAYNKIFLTYELWILYKSKYKLHPTK
jgi:hypothetical protein